MKLKRLQRGTNLNSLTSFDDARLILDENINMVRFQWLIDFDFSSF